MNFCSLLIFFFSERFFQDNRNTNRGSNSLDLDQARHFVGPDLGPNWLHNLSADGTIVGKKLKIE